MTVRDIRQRWPEAERLLAKAGEIVVTRDSQPVARILPYVPVKAKARKRFDPALHMRSLRAFWAGKRRQPSTDEMLAIDRAD